MSEERKILFQSFMITQFQRFSPAGRQGNLESENGNLTSESVNLASENLNLSAERENLSSENDNPVSDLLPTQQCSI